MVLSTVLAIAIGLVFSRTSRSQLSRLLDFSAWRSNSRGVNAPLVSLLIVIALLVTVQPEARVFLMFLDAVGLDFFLLLLTLQGRNYLCIIRGQVITPMWRKLRASGPAPLDYLVFPTLNVMKAFPFLSACSVVAIGISVGFILVLGPVLLVC
jgi:hypothetical protein